jgi:ubiquinone/menaquinone biosynthesis C-methylase UbiE
MESKMPDRHDADFYPHMMRRRMINDFAARPVDFYAESFDYARSLGALSTEAAVLDVGCSSGEFMARGAARIGNTTLRLIGIDPDRQAYQLHYPTEDPQLHTFSFVQARGEAIPLRDNSVSVSMAHNVLFRSDQPLAILAEMQRVTIPGGLMFISTNSRQHAPWRHHFEAKVAALIFRQTFHNVSWPREPAHSFYFETAPELIKSLGGLTIIESIEQRCDAQITVDRVAEYVQAIKDTVNRTNLPTELYGTWDRTVDAQVTPSIMGHINRVRDRLESTGRTRMVYFGDQIARGMLIVANSKPK